jgi:WD40 repeat protein
MMPLASTAPRGILIGHSATVRAVAFGPHGSTVASGSEDKPINIWNPATLALEKTLAGRTNGVFLATGCGDGKIRLWDVGNGTLIATFQHRPALQLVALSLDGKIVASGAEDNHVKLWDVPAGH